MSKLTIYHNGRCSKSRATLELIRQSGQEPRVIHYLDEPPRASELDKLLTILRLEPSEVVRTGEDRFRELGLDRNPPGNRAEWLKLLSENPILIERPIISNGQRAVIGRPPENVLSLL